METEEKDELVEILRDLVSAQQATANSLASIELMISQIIKETWSKHTGEYSYHIRTYAHHT